VNEYAILVAIKPGDTPEIVWENDELLSDVPSPIVQDGLMYLATSYGVIVCYDAVSGEKYWENEFDNGFYGSPMYSDGHIFIMDMDGTVHVFKAGKTYEAVSTNPLGETGMTTPAFMDGRIYLRGNEHLYCIGK
jgi:outer membrane protein assembly factor BamB